MNIFTAITLITALSIAGVAAWFSIIGLMYIFAASAMSIAIMAIVLEIGKLVTASWLYRNWDVSPLGLKLYLIPALIILMFITSLGIFGYLSRAHIESGVSVGESIASIERIDFQIAIENRNIERNESMLSQLDAAIDEFINRGFVTRGLEQRQLQANEREAIQASMANSIQLIDKLSSDKFELETKVRAFETEIGPIKYVAALLYDNPEDHIETAVRYIILLLIFVFDPLAVLLLVAANFSIINDKKHHTESVNLNEDISETDHCIEETEETQTTTDEDISTPMVDIDHEPKFHNVEPEVSETPEHFVKRLVLEYGNPTEWKYIDDKLVVDDNIIAHDICESDAKNIIMLAKLVINKSDLQYHLKEKRFTTI